MQSIVNIEYLISNYILFLSVHPPLASRQIFMVFDNSSLWFQKFLPILAEYFEKNGVSHQNRSIVILTRMHLYILVEFSVAHVMTLLKFPGRARTWNQVISRGRVCTFWRHPRRLIHRRHLFTRIASLRRWIFSVHFTVRLFRTILWAWNEVNIKGLINMRIPYLIFGVSKC